MVVKFIFICVQALALQLVAGQCLNSRLASGPWGVESPLSGSFVASDQSKTSAYRYSALNDDILPLSSYSLFPASGVTIVSENAYEGPLCVSGSLPFLGTVALEGTLPTAGAGSIAYNSVNGEIAMLSEGVGGSRIANPYGSSANGFGLSSGSLSYGMGLGGAAAVPFTQASPLSGYYAGATNALVNPAIGEVYGVAAASASHGGSLPVNSASFNPPSGVSLISDNMYNGALSVTGALPFLGTVALEGALPTTGAGSISYASGNGNLAILKEGGEYFGAVGAPGLYNYGTDAFGYNGALAGPYNQAERKYSACI